MPKRQVYIEPMPLEDALRLWRGRLEVLGLWQVLPGEVVPVDDAIGRITAEAVFARISSPFYHSAAMDGVAVRFADTFGASETSPKRLTVGRQAIYVDTGDPMPDGFDAVIMIEDIEEPGEGEIEIIHPATPWQHVRVVGEDIVATELILPENHEIRPVDAAALLAGGVTELKVRRRPRIVMIPTGTELVQPGGTLKKGEIIEYNSRMLTGMARKWGAEAVRSAIVPDDLERIKKAIKDALPGADMVVVNAGSSAGSEDFSYHAVSELGEALVHGVAIKPGKPVILGFVEGKPVMVVPGYPVSAYLVFRLFARELIYAWQGREAPRPETMAARLSRQMASPLGQEEFIRVKLGKVGENIIATPVSRGAGALMSLVKADGIVRVPAASEGLAAGGMVEIELLKPAGAVEHTVVCIGSHDNALDLLGNFLKKRHPGYDLSSAHVGSLGGIMALARGEAHMAGSHLLDEATGEYNVSFLKKYLADKKPVLINFVYREQGLLVLPGNPKHISGFKSLSRKDVIFVNRQAGAGTRLLTDLYLKRLGMEPSTVRGYEHEEYTHMGVASAVLSGVADTGAAILAAARALGLDFIPVAKERYDLVIPAQHMDNPMVAALLEIMRNDAEFREAVDSLGGYDTSDMGKVMWDGK